MLLVHEMLTKAALDYPCKEAFVYKDKHYTFLEIDEASTKLANFLVSKGVKPGDRIGIYSSKNIEEIIVIFAIMKIACIFVHINPSFKEEQFCHVISDCGTKVLFVHKSRAGVLNKSGLNGFFELIISMSPEINIEQQDNIYYLDKILKETPSSGKLYSGPNENDPAAIIYTSGSTGRAKGVIATHKIFYDSTAASVHILENRAADRLISVTPFSFDGALSQLFSSVFVGGTLVLQEANFPGDIVKTMLGQKITGFHAVPSFWRIMLQKYSPFAGYAYPHLRYVSIIGEIFPREDLMRLKTVLNKTKFYMMYGTTEAFRSTCLHPDDFDKKLPSTGKPLPGVEIMIVDDNGRPCSPGEVGEIVHTGAFVSPGYWNNSVETDKVFRAGRLYTGDLGKIDDEGYLYFAGRKDTMIKSMGYRICPEEIEECLCKITDINEAVVISVPGKEYGNTIKAFLVCSDGSAVTKQEVINYCKTRLPYYMIPNIIEFRTEIPKTATFKINRSQLQGLCSRVEEPGMKRQ